MGLAGLSVSWVGDFAEGGVHGGFGGAVHVDQPGVAGWWCSQVSKALWFKGFPGEYHGVQGELSWSGCECVGGFAGRRKRRGFGLRR